jgi:hypothetical protein
MDLKAALSLGGIQARSELSLVRKSLDHAGQKGSALEKFVANTLKRHLPENIAISEGIVISSDGDISGQLDLIIYDSSAPKFFDNGSTKVIPVEYVYAIVEIKSSLDSSLLDEIFEKHRKIKNYKKYFSPAHLTPMIPVFYHGYGRTLSSPPIYSFVFSFECRYSPQTVLDAYLRHHSSAHASECIDLVYLGEDRLIVRGSTELGLDCGVGDCSTINMVEQDAMFYFIGVLTIVAIQWKMLEVPLIYKYFVGPPPKGLTLRTPCPTPS